MPNKLAEDDSLSLRASPAWMQQRLVDSSKVARFGGGGDPNKAVIPSHVKTYISSLFGDTSPITEKNFSPDEIRQIVSAVQNARRSGRDYVTYRDYGYSSASTIRKTLEQDPIVMKLARQGRIGPATEIDLRREKAAQLTLGAFNFRRDPETQEVVATDVYDFDADLGGRKMAEYAEMSFREKLKVLYQDTVNQDNLRKGGGTTGLAGLPHRIGGAFFEPRPVSINLGQIPGYDSRYRNSRQW